MQATAAAAAVAAGFRIQSYRYRYPIFPPSVIYRDLQLLPMSQSMKTTQSRLNRAASTAANESYYCLNKSPGIGFHHYFMLYCCVMRLSNYKYT